MSARSLGACGDDCGACPRLQATLSADPDALSRCATLWARLGWRDAGFPADRMKCSGCRGAARCAYPELRDCVRRQGLATCGECPDYPCSLAEVAFAREAAHFLRARAVCDASELATLEQAYANKRARLDEVARARPRLDGFGLSEALLWTKADGYFLRELHCERLTRTARYFRVPLDCGQLVDSLERVASCLSEPTTVRISVSSLGQAAITAAPLTAGAGALREPIRLGLALEPVDSEDPWLRHKTTRRTTYERARASRPDCDDAVLHNERDELTEATSSNVVVVIAGRHLTPPLGAGLLPGTFRRWLLEQRHIEEHPLFARDLEVAEAVFLINSVRRWRRCVVVPTASAKHTAKV